MKVLRWAVPMLLLAAACSTQAASEAWDGAAREVAPALVIERFLQAANRDDLATMGRLFGTIEGPLIERDPRDEVEQRMFAIAAILKHEDYAIEGERVVPGRPEAKQFIVRMHIGQRRVPVAYTLVRSGEGAWLIEVIDLEAITSGR